MVYAVSDIHGCFDKYEKMLEKINLSESDVLYVLGDTVDRGDGGIKILLDMMKRKNVTPLKGNHDFLALYYLDNYVEKCDETKEEGFCAWLCDGGMPTYESFLKLGENEKSSVISFLASMGLAYEIELGDRKFRLSHTVPGRARFLSGKMRGKDCIVGEPDYEKVYRKDCYIVTGHTPTFMISEECDGRIYRKNNHIALDCGAVFDRPLGCICLDTFEEFYVL